MKHFGTLLFLFVMQLAGIAQKQEKPINIGDQLLLGASQIEFIKEHGIFLRLRTNDMAIEAFEKAGRKDQVKLIRQRQKEIDDRIIAAFAKQFTFAPVYYFYSRDLDEFKKGNFNNLYKLDGSKAEYKGKDFFMMDPYQAEVRSMNANSTGFTLLTSDAKMTEFPMPDVIIRRFGPIYKTYPQLVFDWNYEFYEMADLAKQIKTGEMKNMIKSKGAPYSRSQRRELLRSRKEHFKLYKKQYNWKERPKHTNNEE